MVRRLAWAAAAILLVPGMACGADNEHATLHLPLWAVTPFALLLLAIALLPVLAGHFWHSNLRKGLVAAVLSAPVVGYLGWLGQPGWVALEEALLEYLDFIFLLWALYTVAGGIVLGGNFKPTPLVNAAFLATGSILANFIGTTGASMVLIRPVLRINLQRQHVYHIPIFFIFLVGNLGGLLTPLGDPPLFLGFLRGVDFFWTVSLWPHWLLANGLVLGLFLLWDTIAYWREPPNYHEAPPAGPAPFQLQGLVNLLFLGGILASVLLRSEAVSGALSAWLRQFFPCPDLLLVRPFSSLAMVAMGLLSLLATPGGLRQANAFTWEAIVEVAVLFAGIFITMVPALDYLKENGRQLGLVHPWQFFWLTGSLSSVLDNAPTYLTFATIAAAPSPHISDLVASNPLLLQAVSCGAVFMGAMTYIGNGPNFMVKAIAEGNGFKTPSFFGYLLYSCFILLPIFLLITFWFFPPP